MQKFIVTVFVLVAWVHLSLGDQDFSKRSTSKGEIQGVVISYEDNSTIGFQFLGIPYAEPPLKDRRYKKPFEKAVWKDVLDATKVKPQCLAYPKKESGKYTEITTENCLHTNVIVPEQCAGNVSCPVLVRIPNTDENPNMALGAYDFAYKNGIVFITISYRIRSFGFMNLSPNLTTSQDTNVALHDITLALKWIASEIHNFGGNPDKITLYGDRNAAFLIDLLSLSPATKHLFSRSILLSASADYREVTKKSSCCTSRVFSINAQCAKSDTEFSTNKDAEIVINCLRSRDPNYLLDVEKKINQAELFEAPMLDGAEGFFTENISSLSANRSQIATLLISFTIEHLDAHDLIDKGEVDEKKLQQACESLIDDEEMRKECQQTYRSRTVDIYNDKRIYFGFIKSALSMIESNSSVYLMEIFGDRNEMMTETSLKRENSFYAKLIASFIHDDVSLENKMEKFNANKHNYYLLTDGKLKPKRNYHTEAVRFWAKAEVKRKAKIDNSTNCCESYAEKQLLSFARAFQAKSHLKEQDSFPAALFNPANFVALHQWTPLHNIWFTVALFIILFAVLFLIRRWIRERERSFPYEALSDNVQLHLYEKKTIYG